jgi:lipopolysaccharide/colanic/teichoic acid biosynthesis glycosyltransferase
LYIFFKNIFDFVLSLLAIIFFLPLILFFILLILIIDRHFPLFFQLRAGKFGKPFYLIKLRTMNSANHLDEFNSITGLGFFLRKFKIDELPQLVNILFGQLSFVGPRPLLLSYVDKYSDLQKTRLNIRPGLTGLAQVNVLDNSNWHKKFEFDTMYVKEMSFILDIKIIFNTFKLLFLIFTNKVNIKENYKFFDNKS